MSWFQTAVHMSAGKEGATVPMYRRSSASDMFPVGDPALVLALARCIGHGAVVSPQLTPSCLDLHSIQHAIFQRDSLTAGLALPSVRPKIFVMRFFRTGMQAVRSMTFARHRSFDSEKISYSDADKRWRLAMSPDGSRKAVPVVRLQQLALVVYKVRCS